MTTEASPFLLADLPSDVRERIYDHVFASDDHEVGGVLVGDVGSTGKAEVHGMIPALEATGARASVTFTHEAWERILAEQERAFPDSPMIIGWYHSHPGFGIFLSEHDIFIQQNFFREPHQVAYVVDPQDETEGIFGWRDGRVELLEEGRTPRRRGRRRPGVVIELDDAESAGSSTAPTSIDLDQRSVPPSSPRRAITVEEEQPGRRRRGLIPLALGLVLLAGVGVALAIGGGSGDPAATPTTATVVTGTGAAAKANAGDRTENEISRANGRGAQLEGQDSKRQGVYRAELDAARAERERQAGSAGGGGGGSAGGGGGGSAGGGGGGSTGGGGGGSTGGGGGGGGSTGGGGGGSTGGGGGGGGGGSGGSTGGGGGAGTPNLTGG